MGSFTTKLSLNQKAFIVAGNLDFYVKEMTVAYIVIEQRSPQFRTGTEPCYVEKYMCVQSGVGSGTVYTYNNNIFSTKEDAEKEVIHKQQVAYKQRAERDAYLLKEKDVERKNDLILLAKLKKQYEEQ